MVCIGGIPGAGSVEYGVMVLGYCPGYYEIQQGKPFVGPAGNLLNDLLEGTGWSRSKVYATNYLCHDGCFNPHLYEEINKVRPRLIIGLGDDVNKLFTTRSLLRSRGQPFYSEEFQCWIMITNQPAAVLHLKNEEPDKAQEIFCDLVRDFRKISSILKWSPPPSKIPFHIILNKDDAETSLNNLGPLVSLDIETRAKEIQQEDAFNDELECYAVYDGTVPLVLVGDALQAKLPERRWLFHNGLFDTSCLMRFVGQKLPINEDTMLASYALDERPGHHTLKGLAREYLGAGFWEEGKSTNIFLYNAFDAYYTFHLHHFFEPRLHSDGVMSLYKDILIPGINMYRDSYAHGMAVDKDIWGTIMLEWFPRIKRMEKLLQELCSASGGPPDINLNSPKQLSTFLYQTLRLRGGPSTDIAHLDRLDHPFVDGLKEHRHLTKMINTYGIGVFEKIKVDGLLHPLPGLHRTKTGRAAYTDPAIQTIPQDYSVGELAVLKKMYVPSKPGYLICEADHSQIEIWMAAVLSQDNQMLSDLTTPFDEHGPNWHSRVARDELLVQFPNHPSGCECRLCLEWRIARYNSKKVTFGVFYLIGAHSLAKPKTGINSDQRTAQLFIDRFYDRYSRFKHWQQEVIREAYEEGEIATPFGNKRRFHNVLSTRLEPEIVNFLIQGTASHWTLCSAIELNESLSQWYAAILCLVHDSIETEFPEENKDEVVALIKRTMEKPKLKGFPSVPVEIKVGPNWFEVK